MPHFSPTEAAELHRRLVAERVPPSALIDGHGRLLHRDAAAERYLAGDGVGKDSDDEGEGGIGSGGDSSSSSGSSDAAQARHLAAGRAEGTLPWLHAALAAPVAAALFSARRYGRFVETDVLLLPREQGSDRVVVGVEPAWNGSGGASGDGGGLALIWFRRYDERGEEPQPAVEATAGARPDAPPADAKAAYRMLDRWLAALAHDLKNPLNLALLSAEVLARRPELRHNEAVHRATETIRGTIVTQVSIINDLLELSRAHAGLLGLRLVAVDLRRALEAIGAALRRSQPDATRCTLIMPGQPIMVLADPVRLDRIINTIAANAQRIVPDDASVELAASNSGGFAQLSIHCDRAPAEALLWRRLLDGAALVGDVPATAGQRVELALIKQFVRLHQGELDVQVDEMDAGATIALRLPALA